MDGIFSTKTLWIFLLACDSDDKQKVSLIMDVIYGIHCLKANNIKDDCIRLYTNLYKDESLKIKHDRYGAITISIRSFEEIISDFNKDNYNNLVAFVTGHGTENCTYGNIESQNLLDILTTINVKNIIIYFGQCYAGIFQYLKLKNPGNIIRIGATKLNKSIGCELNGIDWNTNIFLYFLFTWFKNLPYNKENKKVINSYYYTSIETNNCLKMLNSNELLDIIKNSRELNRLKKRYKKAKNNENYKTKLMLKFEEVLKSQNRLQDTYYNHQESWITNPELASSLEYT